MAATVLPSAREAGVFYRRSRFLRSCDSRVCGVEKSYTQSHSYWHKQNKCNLAVWCVQELQMDLARLWKRNLGRDDRCIAANGKEARYHTLDLANLYWYGHLSAYEKLCALGTLALQIPVLGWDIYEYGSSSTSVEGVYNFQHLLFRAALNNF